MKKDFLHDSIRELATASFSDDSNYLKEKLDALICDSPEDEFDNLLRMQNCNVEMMGFILSGRFEKAERVLIEMREKCNTNFVESVRSLAHSCFNIDTLSFQFGNLGTLGVGVPIAESLETIYPDDYEIRARRIGCQTACLQKQFFVDKVPTDTIKVKADELKHVLLSMSFNGSDSDQALGMTWGALNTLRINFASQKEIEEIIQEAEDISFCSSKYALHTGYSAIDFLCGFQGLWKSMVFPPQGFLNHAYSLRMH